MRIYLIIITTILIGLGIEDSTAQVPEIVPPTVENGKTTYQLPAVVDDICLGGNGRYLLLHFKSLRKIGLFDVNTLKIEHFFAANHDDAKFAAGLQKLLIVSGDSGVITKYDLVTKKRELTQTIDLGGAATTLLMGSSSDGPAIVGAGTSRSSKSTKVINLEDLSSIDFPSSNGMRRSIGGRGRARISANGQLIGVWESGVSPSGLQSYRKIGDQWESAYEHDSVGAIVPSPDGRYLHTGQGIYTAQLKRTGNVSRRQSSLSVPAAHGPFYIAASNSSTSSRSRLDKKPLSLSLKILGDDRPLAQLPDVKVSAINSRSRSALTADKRLYLIPKAKLFIGLSDANDALEIRSFDLESALDKADFDYLFVVSSPPPKVKAGQKFEYVLDVRSKTKGVKYSLDSGPAGMNVSAEGKLTWPTSKNSPESTDVILTVSDNSGQELFHTFTLKIEGVSKTNSVAKNSASGNFSRTTKRSVEVAKLKDDTMVIQFPGTVDNAIVGGGGRYILAHLRENRKIAVFDVAKSKIVKYIPAIDDDIQFAAGANHLLVISGDKGVVTRYNLTSFEKELTQSLPFSGKVQAVGMGSNSFGPALLKVSTTGSGPIDRCRFEFLDLEKLGKTDINFNRQPHSSNRDSNHIRVSTNGELYAVERIGGFRINENKVTQYSGGPLPSADGRFSVSNGAVYNSNGTRLGDNSTNYGLVVPSVQGPYFLSFGGKAYSTFRQRQNEKQSAKLYVFGESRPLLTIPDIPYPRQQGIRMVRNIWQYAASRIFLIPDAKILAYIPGTNDRLIVRKFDVEELLQNSGVDYLVVTSMAPQYGKLNVQYEYQLNVLSKSGGLKFKVESGPTGLNISPTGKVTWNVPEKLDQSVHNVIISVGDKSKQEVFHVFDIEFPEIAKTRTQLAAKQEAQQSSIDDQIAQMKSAAEAMNKQRAMDRERRERNRQLQSELMAKKAQKVVHEFRYWTDDSGKFKIKAKFVEVRDKSSVVLIDESGKEKTIPLSKLSNEDIYEAVKSDIFRQNQQSKKSPFEDLNR